VGNGRTGWAPDGTIGSVKGRGFGRYWLGETISEVGCQITLAGPSLPAITLLGAGPAEVGALATAGFLPFCSWDHLPGSSSIASRGGWSGSRHRLGADGAHCSACRAPCTTSRR
jgi:hypothetical protein